MDLTSHSNTHPSDPPRIFTHLRSRDLSLIPHPVYSSPLSHPLFSCVISHVAAVYVIIFALLANPCILARFPSLPIFLTFSFRLLFVVRMCIDV